MILLYSELVELSLELLTKLVQFGLMLQLLFLLPFRELIIKHLPDGQVDSR